MVITICNKDQWKCNKLHDVAVTRDRQICAICRSRCSDRPSLVRATVDRSRHNCSLTLTKPSLIKHIPMCYINLLTYLLTYLLICRQINVAIVNLQCSSDKRQHCAIYRQRSAVGRQRKSVCATIDRSLWFIYLFIYLFIYFIYLFTYKPHSKKGKK